MKRFIIVLLIILGVLSFAGELKITFINIHQGDSMLVQTPDGRNYLIDGGQPAYYDAVKDIYYSRFDAGRDVILPYLTSLGITRLDGILATHPDADHIGGLVYILKNMPVETVYYTGRLHTSNIFNEFLTLSKQKGANYIEVRDGALLQWSKELLVNVIAPTNGEMASSSNNNNTSIVLFVKYKNTSFILSGDAEEELEERMARDYGDNLRADVLKFGHHGSKSSSYSSYLERIFPKYGIISCGKNNKFGFPHQKMLERVYWANPDMLIARTDYNGHITAVSDGENITFDIEKGSLFTLEEIFKQEGFPLPGKKTVSKTTVTPKTSSANSSVRSSGSLININTAGQSELETLHRVGPKTAQNIINYRDQNGPFKKIEDIMKVPRIGPKTFENFKNSITVGDGANVSNGTSIGSVTTAQKSTGNLVNINTAGQSELETLHRVGPKTAQNIINYRDQNGPFKKIEDIMNVPRIGPKTFENLKGSITVGDGSVSSKVVERTSTISSADKDLVNINTASKAELETLPRVGPATAQNIINYREENGPFKRIKDITNVTRIGEKTFQNLRPYITVGEVSSPAGARMEMDESEAVLIEEAKENSAADELSDPVSESTSEPAVAADDTQEEDVPGKKCCLGIF